MRARFAERGPFRLATIARLTTLVVSIVGCERGTGNTGTPGFMPGWPEARRALESSLSAWRDAPSPLPDSFAIPSVQFVDKQRRPDQRLLSFQILAETDIDNARQFTVRLNLDGEESPQLVKYNVVGRDPVWVFRLDDYEMFAHWEHDMSTPAPGPGERPQTGDQPSTAR